MTAKTKLSHRLLSVLMCAALLLTYLPLSALTASAANRDSITRLADDSTMNDWQKFFPTGSNINTENAGGIWTDKSVFTDDTAFSDITMEEDDSFLVALSAMGSNMTVTGMSSVPADTMLVLDVSGSMQGNASTLATAANQTIKALLEANKNNRVGVILYSGPSTVGSSNGTGDAIVLLPLGRYTTTDANGRYINYGTRTYIEVLDEPYWNRYDREWVYEEEVSISNNIWPNETLVVEGTSTKPALTEKQVVGGTYIQSGVALAKDQFTAAANTTTITDPNMGVVKRKPILVLMSDGAPTLGSTNFTNPTNSHMGNGQSSSAAMGFVTQLSISYAKQQIEAKYQNDALVYTLGVGLTSSTTGYEVARSVLNPDNTYTDASANGMRTFWDRYLAAKAGDQISVRGGDNPLYVTKADVTLEELFVDRYFSAANASAMIQAFQSIVADISLQSKYFPTLIESNENLSGYITFVDNIGKYMEVTGVEGIRLHQTLFSGADLASNFVAGGGELGTYEESTILGDELVRAVRARIGTPDADVARTLIGLAYENGQLAYNAATGEFSNYIGWFADADGKYLGFWHENISAETIPANAAYIIKSYGYLGETNEAQGTAKSDMMYAEVQVREDMATGEQTVKFAVPAALIPTVTYAVTLGENGALQGLTVGGATAPIRLVYKVALRKDINEFTVNEVVDSAYLAANTANGKVSFYTNQYEVDNSTGYQKVNTLSYFRPSRQNDRYYYQQSSYVYTDTNGTLYRGNSKPSGTMYHAYTVYEKGSTGLKTRVAYHALQPETLDTAERTDDTTNTTWYIPVGDVRRDYTGYQEAKETNTTGTLPFSAAPFTDIYGHNVNDTSHSFVAGATLGNNGKLTMNRESGIKITKALTAGTADVPGGFNFVITGASAGDHAAYKLLANGQVDASVTTVTFDASGTANVNLLAGETLYIGGMTAGQEITVKEVETEVHKIYSVNDVTTDKQAVLTVTSGAFQLAGFVNTDRGTGNLTVAKEVTHPFGDTYEQHLAKTFTMEVTLTLNGAPLAGKSYTALQSKNTAITGITTDAAGKFTVTLTHDDQIQIFGIPAEAEAVVVEAAPGTGFAAPAYWDNGVIGDGVVTIAASNTASVIVVNDYQPASVYPVNIQLAGTKTVSGRTPDAWIDADSYTFVLEQYDFAAAGWVQLGNKITVDKDTANHAFDFSGVFADTNFKFDTAGTYYYRVREEAGSVPGVTYDTTLHSFAVLVGDETMDGALEIISVTPTRDSTLVQKQESTYQITTNFTNVYQPDETAVAVEIAKKVNNPSGSPLATLDGFVFEIYKYDPDAQQPGDKVATTLPTSLTGAARTSLTFTEAGTYHYAVKEVQASRTGWTYTDAIVPITVVVNDDGDGNLSAKAYVSADGDAGATSTVAVSFTNAYQLASVSLPIDFVSKQLSGRAMAEGEFSFKLTGVNYTVERIGKNLADSADGQTDGIAKVAFDALTFDKVGTYYHNIVETTADGKGITTDKTTYRLTVTVTDEGGALKASYQIVNAEGSTITFVNSYTAAPVKHAIEGKKVLTGRALINDEFTFILTEAVDAAGTVPTGAKTYTARNTSTVGAGDTGSFIFPEITYNAPGSYYYTVTEKGAAGDTLGITYDETKFVVTVVVEDKGLGVLEVSSVTYGGHDNLTFNNTYTAKKTDAAIPVSKLLNGRVLNDEEFSFSLYRSDAQWNEGAKIDTVKNNESGEFTFGSIAFTGAGNYYYLVREDAGNKGGITYDTTVYRVRVEVTDDLRGQLHANIFVFDDLDIPQAGVTFINEYTISGTANVKLEGTKTLTGRDMVDGEFAFQLFETGDDFTITGDAKQTVYNADGKVEFALNYTPEQVGQTFYYVVMEQNAGETLGGVTYSNTVYKVTVEVGHDNLGSIATTTTISDGANTVTKMVFANEYHEKAELEIQVNKKVENKGDKKITAEGFTFLLEKVGTQERTTVKSDASGKASFPLTFTEADIGKTYTYKVTEVNDHREHVKYSKAAYTIEVAVSLNSDHLLEITVKQDGKTVEAPVVEFINVYEITTTPVTGDSATLHMWIALAFASGTGIFGISAYDKKKKKAE